MSTAEKLSQDLPNGNETDPLLGKVLNDKYKLIAPLATGGMGTVYRGEQIALERPVAIKVLIPDQASLHNDPNFQKRFFLEASFLAKLQHPNIVTVFDYGRIEGIQAERYFMVMELLPGETLYRRLHVNGRIPPPEAMGIARQIARGLREAHKRGVVHRDLKPSNIMLVPNEDGAETVKVLDFGLVKVLADDSEELTQQGSFLGSPRYMSPEQISHGKVDLRTDVYSLGVILYQMLCGKVPFESEKSVPILLAHLQSPVPPMRERNPEADVPEALEAFVMRCLAKNPEGRPSDMDAFIRMLGECAQAIGLSTPFGATSSSALDSFPGASMLYPVPTLTPPGSSAPSTYALRSTQDDEQRHKSESGRQPSAALPVGADSSSPVIAEGSQRLQKADFSTSLAPPTPRRNALFYALGAVVLLGAAFFAARRYMLTPVAPAVAPPEPSATADPFKSFVLVIESMPSGAEVFDGKDSLGTTPLRVSVTNESVREHPRRYLLKLPGYRPYSIVQGPSDQSVHVVATLIEEPSVADASAEAAAQPTTPHNNRPNPHSPKPPRTSSTPATTQQQPGPKPLDIQTER